LLQLTENCAPNRSVKSDHEYSNTTIKLADALLS